MQCSRRPRLWFDPEQRQRLAVGYGGDEVLSQQFVAGRSPARRARCFDQTMVVPGNISMKFDKETV